MRCLSCNCVLTDYEATRKSAKTGEYIDLCNTCFQPIEHEIDVIDNPSLNDYTSVKDEADYGEDNE